MRIRLILEYDVKMSQVKFAERIKKSIKNNNNIDAHLYDADLVFASCEPVELHICTHDGKTATT